MRLDKRYLTHLSLHPSPQVLFLPLYLVPFHYAPALR
ncbi:hypothetical protein N7465_007970 [Penicillium sp. CMV-2018d]|nr:hypothetical protein N7465_007970 [Penicillium sp. CMV-2018d]